MLNAGTVNRIAELARLDLTDAERSLLATQLTAIVDYVDQLRQVDSPESDVDGAAAAGLPVRPVPQSLTLRPDIPTPSLPRDVALARAPAVEAGQIRVPRFLPEEG